MEDNKTVARAFYDAITSGDVDALDAVCTPDMRGHAGAGATLQDLKQSTASFHEAFPDQRIDVRYLVTEGDLVSTWVSYTATHQAPFAGVPATRSPVKFAAWDLMRVRDGKIVELTQYCDLFTLLNQIGALATVAPA